MTTRILVIGIRAEHAQNLTRMFRGQASFTFITDGATHRGKVKGDFELVLSLYKFTNHTVEQVWGGFEGYVRVRSYSHVVELLSILLVDDDSAPSSQ